MKLEEAEQLKMAVTLLHEDVNCQTLMKFLDLICGIDGTVNYDQGNATSVAIATGRLEVWKTIRTINRLQPEEIMAIYNNEGEAQ